MREIKTHGVDGGPDTVQVFAEEELGPGGAPHHYEITTKRDFDPLLGTVDFQKGPVLENGINGVTHEAHLAIIIDRLEHFQEGPYPSEDNQAALEHARTCLAYLQKRTRERILRGVEGQTKA